ncbi:ALF repeat-containing protein [Streptomyces sp. NPDC058289]|uniref:ALF repeat-containing protein n=1 Tax=Streptomyces sp. NPDC058289 TaxID=3346425 RepID=UPI0036EFA0E2
MEAANHAGQAVDYANRSTAAANAALEAAGKAADAVAKASEVEQAAREAESARLDEETAEAIEQARVGATAETGRLERLNRERTQEARLDAELLALIGAAESALKDGRTAGAVTAGRKAAVRLIERAGTWTRTAAEFALAGSDEDVAHWIDADRVIALRQDNAENVAATAAVSTQKVALAAAAVLKTEDAAKIRTFLESGAIEAAKEDNRVEVTTVLADDDTGPAVRRAAEAALEKGTAEALHAFLHVERAAAVREDDRVKATTLLVTGGPYAKAAAKVALEGDTDMLRQFIGTTQYEFARIDHDRATHISAVRAMIAGAAKVAQEAQENAARASEAAALARNAAEKAAEWAQLAKGYAADAKRSGDEARRNAEAAEGSAAAAARSAETAALAAAAARKSGNVARQAATRAVQSATVAADYAATAAAAAVVARVAALAAGMNVLAAARAAFDAKVLVIDAALREAAQKALDNATVPIKPQENGLPDGAESCLTPFGKPIESDNSTNPWELGRDWLLGTGPKAQCFGPDDEFTTLYRDHEFTKQAVAYFRRPHPERGLRAGSHLHVRLPARRLRRHREVRPGLRGSRHRRSHRKPRVHVPGLALRQDDPHPQERRRLRRVALHRLQRVGRRVRDPPAGHRVHEGVEQDRRFTLQQDHRRLRTDVPQDPGHRVQRHAGTVIRRTVSLQGTRPQSPFLIRHLNQMRQ